jgi:hypothetical protein
MKVNKILLLFLLLVPAWLYAEECDEFSVSFMVDGDDQWNGMKPVDIYQQENEMNAAETEKKQGIALKDLIAPYADKRTLVIYACGGKSKSVEVAELLSVTQGNQDLLLVLSKKNFFKLVDADNKKPILKKVNQLKLMQ